MSTAAAKDAYEERKKLVEPVFGIIKEQMGVRGFLLRGLIKVRQNGPQRPRPSTCARSGGRGGQAASLSSRQADRLNRTPALMQTGFPPLIDSLVD